MNLRTKKALLFSVLIHAAALLCLQYVVPSPIVKVGPEQIFRVTLINIPATSPKPSAAKVATSTAKSPGTDGTSSISAPTPAQHSSPFAQQNSPTESNSPGGTMATDNIDGNGNSNVVGRDSQDIAPAALPGSRGYENAAAINKVPPVYPVEQEQGGIGGTAYIRITVTANGSVSACELAQSSGNDALDLAAVTAAWQCTFRPAKDIATGETVPSVLLLPFFFESPDVENEDDPLW